MSDFEPADITLRNGRRVHLRALRSTDADEILQAFERLSEEARYMRFMGAVKELDQRRLRATLAHFPQRGAAIAATVPAADGIDIVGAASFIIGPDSSSCEFSITVADAWKGAGLGKRLMLALIDAARRRGLRMMEGYVLASNQPMLGLAQGLGFQNRPDPGEPTVRIVRLALDQPATGAAPDPIVLGS